MMIGFTPTAKYKIKTEFGLLSDQTDGGPRFAVRQHHFSKLFALFFLMGCEQRPDRRRRRDARSASNGKGGEYTVRHAEKREADNALSASRKTLCPSRFAPVPVVGGRAAPPSVGSLPEPTAL